MSGAIVLFEMSEKYGFLYVGQIAPRMPREQSRN